MRTPQSLQWLLISQSKLSRKPWWHVSPRFLTVVLALFACLGPILAVEMAQAGRWFGNGAFIQRRIERRPNGLIARIYDRRHDQRPHVDPRPQPHVDPAPVPVPDVIPVPTPDPAPPINPPQPATPDPVVAIAAGHLWVVEVVPSMLKMDSAQASIVESANVWALLQTKGNHRWLCDQSSAPATITDAIARAVKDGLPRAILLDDTKPKGTWIVGSIPLVSVAELTTHVTAYQNGAPAPIVKPNP